MINKYISKLMPDEGTFRLTFFSLLVSFLSFFAFYFFILDSKTNFIQRFSFSVIFIIITNSLIVVLVSKIISYKNFPCMPGMMIGMTIGMISGFLAGFYLGITNGFLYGSFFGIIIGLCFGVITGKTCGIMGILEGVMAGFMGGIMGAMTAVMLINDNFKLAGAVFFFISLFILLCLNYMVSKETKYMEANEVDNLFFVIFWSLLLNIFSLIFIVIGPRSGLFL